MESAPVTPPAPASGTPPPTSNAAAQPQGTDAKTPGPKPDLNLTLEEARALKQKAAYDKKLRADKEAFEKSQTEAKAKYERFEKFSSLEKDDPLGALGALGLDVDDLIRRVNDAIIRQHDEQSDPALAAVRKALKEEREAETRQMEAARAERMNTARTNYTAVVQKTLAAQAEQYPTVIRAIGTGDLHPHRLFDVAMALAEANNNQPLPLPDFLAWVEGQLNPKLAAPKEEPKAEEKPPQTSSPGGMSDLNATAARLTDEEIDRMSKDEYFAYVKRLHGLR